MMTSAVNHYFGSSIGRKQLVAITGLLLCGFLVGHLSGNFLLMVGPDAFNLYSHKLISLGALLWLIEAGLGLVFLVHLGLAFKLTIENKKARGVQKYAVKKNTGRGTTFMSATMPYTGLVLLVFLILHLMNLKFGSYYETTVGGVVMRDIYRTTMEYFANPVNVAWYVVAMVCAALHTAHGFASAFQSLGLNHGKYYSKIKLIGYVYAVAVGGGFAFLSVWAYLKGV
ncbi:succinate dehydrogenase cytochrome b subunit [Peredibacter sp. HCB2-198]|uniref:succinate dehydrogenase cytochrome b subunit n=1 Tax=Peredibacter sp. HCB2-198 TaxID=3383025 RepID=UPI0038B5567B